MTSKSTRRIRMIESDIQYFDCASDSENETETTTSPTSPTTTTTTTEQESSSIVPMKVRNLLGGRGCKVLFNGDGNAGKTSFLIRATHGTFPVDYIPTVFDNYVETIVSEKYDIAMMMGLWDTFGRSDYDRLRPLSYPNTDLMVLCFDVSSRTQFESIFSKYLPEVKHHVPGATLLLLGLKSDLRNNAEVVAKLKQRQLTMVSRDEAEQLARKFNMPYMELSALDDAEGCKAALQTFATMVVERYLPKAPKVDGSGLFGFVKRMFSWATTTNKTMMANANQKQIDESSVIEAETN